MRDLKSSQAGSSLEPILGRRSFRRGVTVLALALAIASATAFAVASLGNRSIENAEGEVQLAKLASNANMLSALEWQAVSEGAVSDDIADGMTYRRGLTNAAIEELGSTFGSDDPLVRSVTQVVRRYELALAREVQLLERGDYRGALAVDEESVDPAFEILHKTLDAQAKRFSALSQSSKRWASLGITASLLVGALAAALLFWRLEHARVRVARREALEKSERHFRSLVRNSSDLITVVDREGMILDQTDAVQSMLGHDPADLKGLPLSNLLHIDDRPLLLERVVAAASSGGIEGTIECRMRHGDGSWRRMETSYRNLLDDPDVKGIVLNSRDVSERVKLQDELAHQAFHDSLTGLANRVLFTDRLQHAFIRQERRPQPLAVLFIDLNDFKGINDVHGHAAGDQVLISVSERLTGCMRKSDTAARLGGDEFGILLDDMEEETHAHVVAERIERVLRLPFMVAGKEVHMDASIGVALASSGTSHEELLRNADIAMYAAKQESNGGYLVFDPNMHAVEIGRMELKSDLDDALRSGQLALHYQPIVALDSQRIVGVEALLRWMHPDRGLIPPLEFIPLAEESGMIMDIGRWVLNEACRTVSGWRDVYPSDPPIYVSVNLSAKQLQDNNIVADVEDALRRSDLDPAALLLEVTETVVMQDTERIRGRLKALKALGVRLAIDDFGTGHSSLGRLHDMPVDILKMDKLFVDKVDKSSGDAAFARAIVRVADELGLETIAEGIEEMGQLSELRSMGCQLGQGFYFARPAVPDVVERLLQDQAVELPTRTGVR